MWAVIVSSSPAVFGFSSFWLTVFSKRRSFIVLQYHSLFVLSSLINYFSSIEHAQKTVSKLFLDILIIVNDYTISDIQSMFELLWHPMTRLFGQCIDKFEGFSHFLTMAEVDFWGIPASIKQTREMDTTLHKRD